MVGGGPVRIVNGVAWGETFRTASANIELEGTGMSIRSLEIQKSDTGAVRGYANVVWDGTYGFQVDGTDISIDTLDTLKSSMLPLTGRLGFTALGAGSFRAPAYSIEGSIQDFFIGDEGVGPVSGRLAVADNVMTLERVFVTSPRFVALLASGTIALDDVWTSNLSLRFQGASLAPFLKFVLSEDVARRLSPYTRLEAGGSITLNGPLSDRLALRASVTVEEAALTLFDYPVSNDGPIQLTLDRGALAIGSFKVKGENTNLAVTGGADARARTYDLHATGNASLAILQLFFRNLTASGTASLNASLTGPAATAQLTGQASIASGRLRPLDSPHGLEAVNGSLIFGSDGIRLCEPSILAACEPLTGRLGTGEVRFGGSISLDGLLPRELNLTAIGRSMRLRYPAGFTSTVDMDLFLTGPVDSPHLSGDVDVLRLSYEGAVNADAGLLALSAPGAASAPSLPRSGRTSSVRMTLDIRVSAPHTSFIDTRTARIDGQADLRVRGTFDQPQIDGQVDILGGEYQFNGNRIFVRDTSTIDFRQGDRLEPVFDILAETRVRVTGQMFTVTIGLRGTFDGLNVSLTSEPYLPEADIVTLLFGGTPDWGSPEQRALGSSQELQQRMFQTAGAVLLTSALTSRVGDVFERTGALDTVQITPVLNDAAAFQKLDPGARVTLGKRISPRVFLTYSRTFNTGQEELILLEYDQSDRMSWVLSRNGEDGTYALDFRIRYVF
jgi:autotransporter translocation and assembly factor TamB